MTGHHPLVSVCIPAYNCEKYLADTLNCLLGQTYKNTEIVIVDDGSTDGTRQIAEGFRGIHIRLFSQKNAGASAARNAAFRESKGDYIKFMDGDDLINPEMIENQLKLAIANEDGIISAKWGRFYDNDITTFKLNPEECWQNLPAVDWLCSSWKNGNSMTQPAIFLMPRRTIEAAGLWDEQLTLIDDLDFFTRVILKSDKVIFDANSTLYYRSGNDGSLSDYRTKDGIMSAFKAIDQATKNLSAVNSGAAALQACANLWQNFIYYTYPKYPELIAAAQKKVTAFGGSQLKFNCGGLTKILVGFLGWKIAARLKHLF